MVDLTSFRQRLLLSIGSIGPLGHLPASGTATVAVIGVPLFWLMHGWPFWTYTGVTLSFTAVAVWLHTLGDRILGEKDSRRLVWDELAGFLFAVALVPFTWRLAVLAFLLERVIDILKVPPANWIERHWPGGFGVVGDDVVAGLYTRGLLHAAISFAPSLVGLSE